MSTTILQSFPPSNSNYERRVNKDAQDDDTASSSFRLRNPDAVSSSTPGPSNASPSHRQLQQPPSQADEFVSKGRARIAMTPQPQPEMSTIQPEPQRTPLSLAVAMKAATSPAMASFPDAFWVPFLEQEEYDRQKMIELQEYNERRRMARQERQEVLLLLDNHKNTTIHRRNLFSAFSQTAVNTAAGPNNKRAAKSQLLSTIVTTMAMLFFRMVWNLCVCLGILLLLASLLDVPYFRRIFEDMAFAGRFVLGVLLWIYEYLSIIVAPTARSWLSEHLYGEL